MPIYHIELDGISIEISHKRIKNMHLRVYPPAGLVRVSAPLHLSRQDIIRQLEEKKEWIRTQQARLKARPAPAEITMQTGETHYFMGQPYPLQVIEQENSQHVLLCDEVLRLSTKPKATVIEKEKLLNAWYQAQMHSLIPGLLQKWQPILCVDVREWGTKTMKTRWGSCNTRARRIWLNLNLIKKTILCLEYVLVHEMVHLLEASHNARFYQLMDRFMPDWRTHQKSLYLPTDYKNL
jgi:predicted metal-dependent hydrolase